jgi:predicted enzyme related to lactoylglutathione lyase
MDHTIVHFEIPADDLDRASTFYRDVFGWEIAKMPGPFEYYGVRTTATDETGMPKGPGVNGGMMKRMHPGQVPTNYIGVADIDAHTAKLVEAGGEVCVPKMAVPGHGWLVQFKDPEGNVLALWQPDSKAA